jgi:proline racemase
MCRMGPFYHPDARSKPTVRLIGCHVPGATTVVTTGGGHMTRPDESIEQLRRVAVGD